MAMLDHGDVELSGQTEKGHGRQQRRHDPGERRAALRHLPRADRRVRHLPPQVRRSVEQCEYDEGAHRQEGDQLDHRLEGDRQHHAAMLFGGLHVAHAEQDGEQRHQRRHHEGGVGMNDAGWNAVPGRRCGDAAERRRHRLKLQGDVGQHADGREQCRSHADRTALAVARGEEVGDRGDVVLLGKAHHFAQQRRARSDHQHRAGINQDEVDARRRRAAHRPVESPGGAVDRQRQAIDRRRRPRSGRPGTLVPIPEIGDGEQQAEIGQREGQYLCFGDHFPSFSGRFPGALNPAPGVGTRLAFPRTPADRRRQWPRTSTSTS